MVIALRGTDLSIRSSPATGREACWSMARESIPVRPCACAVHAGQDAIGLFGVVEPHARGS